ncbi:MAG: hypothetical protein JHC26_12680 [Thermofilum sp.]|uniref:hypothetical protein n=1 Tax=Thermofilum sp. TaxID=1961369 RepID=UPI00258B384D|nr:hypothetical protein [Thermofilum sp.]MCI4409941.1 hypothetical protein [Thermofilum sp.]
MSTANDDHFIEDLHNAVIWITYYDVITLALYGFIFFSRFNHRLDQLVKIYEKYL